VVLEIRKDIVENVGKLWNDTLLLLAAVDHIQQRHRDFSEQHQRLHTVLAVISCHWCWSLWWLHWHAHYTQHAQQQTIKSNVTGLHAGRNQLIMSINRSSGSFPAYGCSVLVGLLLWLTIYRKVANAQLSRAVLATFKILALPTTIYPYLIFAWTDGRKSGQRMTKPSHNTNKH